MPYLKVKDCVDCGYLAELVLRRGGDDHYDAVERLAKHLRLKPKDKLKVKSNLRRMLEGSYLKVRKK